MEFKKTVKSWGRNSKTNNTVDVDAVEIIDGVSTRTSIEFSTRPSSYTSSLTSERSLADEVKYLQRLVNYGDEDALARLTVLQQKRG